MDAQQLKILKMNQCLQSLLDLIRGEILLNNNFIFSHEKKILIQIHEEILFLFQYAVNNTQAIIYLAKNDCSNSYSLVHSAFVVARVVIETNARICWLLQPEYIDFRIERYISFLEKELTGIREYKKNYDFSKDQITGVDQRIESREDYIKNLNSAVLESKFFSESGLQDLVRSNKMPKDFDIIKSVYADKLSYLQFDYMVLSKFVHSMLDVIYPLMHESQDLSHDWDTPFRVCFIALVICSDKLFDRFDINSDNFLSKLIPIVSEFHKLREPV